jgi:hypothetical protein
LLCYVRVRVRVRVGVRVRVRVEWSNGWLAFRSNEVLRFYDLGVFGNPTM